MSTNFGSEEFPGSLSGDSRLKIAEVITLSSEESSFEVPCFRCCYIVDGESSKLRIQEEEKESLLLRSGMNGRIIKSEKSS